MVKKELGYMTFTKVEKNEEFKQKNFNSSKKNANKKSKIKSSKNKFSKKIKLFRLAFLAVCFCFLFSSKANSKFAENKNYKNDIMTLENIESFRSFEEIDRDNAILSGSIINTRPVIIEDKLKGIVEISYNEIENEKKQQEIKEKEKYDLLEHSNMKYVKNQKRQLTEKEIAILERLVMAEAEGEGIIGQILVANVVFNRIDTKGFPSSLESVVFQHSANGIYQFSCMADSRYYTVEVSEEVKNSVALAIEGYDFSQGALYFCTKTCDTVGGDWQRKNLEYLFSYKNHEFRK